MRQRWRLLAAAALPLLAQGPPASISISASSARLVSATSMKLQATARDSLGRPRSGDTITWTSSNGQVASVTGDGTVTGAALGHSDITASIAGLRSSIRIQVLPSRIVVTPAAVELYTGRLQQFTAGVLNANGEPIPDTLIEWSVLNSGGGNQNSAIINASGLFRANLTGRFTIRATFRYSAGIGFVTEYSGTSSVRVYAPEDYKLTPLLTSDTVRENVRLRPRRGILSVNDSGRIVFSASLEGVNTGIVRYQDGQTSVVAEAGLPGAVAGTRIWDLTDPNMNSSGAVLLRTVMQNAGTSLLLITPDGARWAHIDGSGAPGVSTITNASISRWSLTDSADNAYLFRASFRWAGDSATQVGLFKSSAAGAQPVVTSQDDLPTLKAPVNLDDPFFMMDAAGAIVFRASDPNRTAWFRVDPATGRPAPLIGTGDMLDGNRIRGFYGADSAAISQQGDVAIAGSFENGPNFIARWRGGAGKPEVLTFGGGFSFVASTQGAVGTLFAADVGRGRISLNLWRTNGSLETYLTQTRPGPTGEPVQDFWSAAMNSRGEIFASVTGVDTPWYLVKIAGGEASVLLSSGAELNAAAPVHISNSIPGDHTGPWQYTFGGNQWSVFEIGADGLVPRLLVGDRLPGGALFMGDYQPRKSANGDLYVPTNAGLFRVNNEAVKLHFGFPFRFTDQIQGFAGTPFMVTDSGQFLMYTNTNDNHGRLALVTNGEANAIAYAGTNPRWQTPLPGGGTFESWNELVLNENGLVLGMLRPRSGPAGLYLYDAGAWNAICVVGSCEMFGFQVASMDNLKAAGGYLFARFNGTRNERVMARWSAGTWTPLLRSGDSLPNGAILSNFNIFDANRGGDALVWTFDGGNALLVVGDKGLRDVYQLTYPTREGTYLRTFLNGELRDDGRVFFTAFDYLDRIIAYAATPQY